MSELAALQKSLENCQACGLAETRMQVVFGTGPHNARLMLVGEAPGRTEDEGGQPFMGAAGKILMAQLQRIGLTREDVYIANTVKCRPPKNRNPRRDELAACTPHLLRQVDLVHPRVLVTLGNFATQTVLNTTQPITQLRGALHWSGGTRVVPTFHPAAALYDRNKLAAIEEDFNLAARVLRREL